MATIYFDTSALVRRYDVTEPGAHMVRAVCLPAREHTIIIAEMTSIEMASAFAQKARNGSFSATAVDRLWRLFKAHQQDEYQILTLTESIIERSERLLFGHSLQAYDAVQIGSALSAARVSASELEYWTADRRQASVAAAEGLTVQLVG